MKKILSVFLAVIMAIGCLAIGAFAEETEPTTPEASPSGFYIGKRFAPGEKITSAFDTCETFRITYSVAAESKDFVTSEMQSLYADENFKGVVSFRDDIASFTSGDIYKGSYTLLDIGGTVGEMETENGKFKTAYDIKKELDLDEEVEFTLTLDYKHSKTTLIQYTSLTAWEIVTFVDMENKIDITVQAIFEAREPNGFESFLESIYTKWLEFLDWLGDILIKVVPSAVELWAKILGKK